MTHFTSILEEYTAYLRFLLGAIWDNLPFRRAYRASHRIELSCSRPTEGPLQYEPTY